LVLSSLAFVIVFSTEVRAEPNWREPNWRKAPVVEMPPQTKPQPIIEPVEIDEEEEIETVDECNDRCGRENQAAISVCFATAEGPFFAICMAGAYRANNNCRGLCNGDIIPADIPQYQPPHF